jgi:hypothetical protein
MKHFLTKFIRRRRARAALRDERELERAAEEMWRREHWEPTIWRSGKGGSHPGQ